MKNRNIYSIQCKLMANVDDICSMNVHFINIYSHSVAVSKQNNIHRRNKDIDKEFVIHIKTPVSYIPEKILPMMN